MMSKVSTVEIIKPPMTISCHRTLYLRRLKWKHTRANPEAQPSFVTRRSKCGVLLIIWFVVMGIGILFTKFVA